MGAIDEAKGKAKGAIGDITGNKHLKNEGKVDRGNAVDEAADKVTRK